MKVKNKVWILKSKEYWWIFSDKEEAIEKFKKVGDKDSIFQKLVFKGDKIESESISWKDIALGAIK